MTPTNIGEYETADNIKLTKDGKEYTLTPSGGGSILVGPENVRTIYDENNKPLSLFTNMDEDRYKLLIGENNPDAVALASQLEMIAKLEKVGLDKIKPGKKKEHTP